MRYKIKRNSEFLSNANKPRPTTTQTGTGGLSTSDMLKNITSTPKISESSGGFSGSGLNRHVTPKSRFHHSRSKHNFKFSDANTVSKESTNAQTQKDFLEQYIPKPFTYNNDIAPAKTFDYNIDSQIAKNMLHNTVGANQYQTEQIRAPVKEEQAPGRVNQQTLNMIKQVTTGQSNETIKKLINYVLEYLRKFK